MRLLIVINSLNQGGAEALVKDMAPRLRTRGVDVSLAVFKHFDSPFEHAVRDAGVPFVELSSTGIYSPLQAVSLARHLADFDVAQSFLFPAQLYLVMAASWIGEKVPLVTSEQNTTNRRRDLPFRALDAWMYKHYQFIPCASQAIADALVEWAPGIASRVSVIHNAADVERFVSAQPASKKEIVGRDDVPVAIFTARMEPQKDHSTVLRAIQRVDGLHLVLLGDGPERPSLQKLAHSLGIADRVHFLGRRRDVPELLKMADVYVHCSHSEGFGIAALEAMAAGLPLVVSDVPGLAQVVGSAALLVPPGAYELMAQHIQSVLSSSGLRHRLSHAGRERAPLFGIEQTVEQYLAIYRKVTEAAAKPS